MNAIQKATLMLSLVVLPLLLLFMRGMEYRGILLVSITVVSVVAALVYALRTKPTANIANDAGES